MKRKYAVGLAIACSVTFTLFAVAADAPTRAQMEPQSSEMPAMRSQTNPAQGQPHWAATIGIALISFCLGPVAISFAKSKSELNDKNLSYAWDAARITQQQLIESKDSTILGMREEITRLQTQVERLREIIDRTEVEASAADKRAFRAEQLSSLYRRQLQQYEPTPTVEETHE